jgi:hypothetical protein
MLENVAYEEQNDCYRSQNITALIARGLLSERSIKRTWEKEEFAQDDGL